ncbi:Zn-dependent hydrolase [Microvirga pudoricolor]|uniref:Zn-dependent hydrolase n=1 Tax=Microvirga pudoricolor TaxID=2778729 RepID=UPI0019503E1B|nr:Zn-dependent hydrolase [Microvirga pudoricolor]
MSTRNLPVDGKRLWDDLMTLADITDPDQPWTRRAFSARFLEGREWLRARMEEAGLEVRLDTGGNLIGRRPGRVPGKGTIVVGSHTDTVPNGGRFDGPAGVITGLEIARALQDRGIELDHDLEVIDCLAEEVSIYGLSCVGSRAMAGLLDETALARTSPDGEILRDGLRRMGGDDARLADAIRGDIAAYFELHIEQGPVLEEEKLDIGVVTAIAGITRWEIVVEGRADHAGTTPMDRRADALVAASELVLVIRALGHRRSKDGLGHFAATVGEFRIEPNAANVVPSGARILIDARAEHRPDMDGFEAELDEHVRQLAEKHGVTIAPPRLVSDNRPTPAAEPLMKTIEAAADAIGATHRRMASGAGHDMAWVARVAPASMLFIPCREGRSHTPEEWAEPDAIALGASVLFEAVRRFDAASHH